MSFALLWIDALLCSLLWIATGLAIIGRIRCKWIRILLWPIVWAPPFFYPCVFLLFAVAFRFMWKYEPDHFAGALSLFLAYIVGLWFILRMRRDGKPQPTSARWPILLLLLCLIAFITCGYLYIRSLNAALRHRLISWEGKVTSAYLAGLQASTPPSENAAPIYELAFKNLHKDDGSDVSNLPIGNATTFNPDEPATLAHLKRQAGTLELLRRAASLPACRFDSDMPPINQATMTNFVENFFWRERAACELLDLDAREQMAHHNAAMAIEDAATLLKMSRQLMQRPLLVSALSAYVADLFGNEPLAMALPMVNRRNELADLDFRSLAPIGKVVRQALLGEELFGLSRYISPPPHVNPYTNNTEIDEPPRGPLGRVLFLDFDQYLVWMAKLQNLITQPYFEVRDQLPTADGPRRVFGNCAKVWVLSDARCFETFARTEAGDACAEVAVAMTQYRVDHGHLPDKLAELVPKYLDAIPSDPFDGKPLRLVIGNNTWIIYSVGPNGIDDGGVGYDKTHKTKDDVTFTLKAPSDSPTTKR